MEPLANVQLITNEISIKNNHLPDGKFQINHSITRNINTIDDTHVAVELVYEIINSEEHPFPIDVRVSLTGIFDLSNIPQNAVEHFLKYQAVQILYPYVRTMVTNITASSFMPPIIPPVIDVMKLFPEE